ncbi:MAG: hypothetical protein HKO63_05465 [Acidimicrobiia bacterium]|nr:hypothetical protein [Acidimicrobiia bacterium]
MLPALARAERGDRRATGRLDTVVGMGMPAVGATHEESVRFTQEQFDTFARLSGDDNPIHVDPDFAVATHFGGTVAHGMMLFGVLHAATTRWLPEPATPRYQNLMFPAPTFAGPEYRIRLEIREREPALTIAQTIVADDGTETAVGDMIAWSEGAHPEPQIGRRRLPGPDKYKGFRLGMTARASRLFVAAEVEGFRQLIDDRDPLYQKHELVPPALVGGTVSHLLGVELPGPGANWLKQWYEFERPVFLGEELITEVELVRFRPEKHLVDLWVRGSVDGWHVLSGRSLVHTRDVKPR